MNKLKAKLIQLKRAITRKRNLGFLLVPVILFFAFRLIALQTNNINFVFPRIVETAKVGRGFAIYFQPVVYTVPAEAMQSVVREKVIEVKTCDWSRECVEAYIDEICGEDRICASWMKYTSAHEGDYYSQWDQYNNKDSHFDGKTGSWGQMQFGEGTYLANCEPNTNWKMDWRAQIRCAKKLWDNGSYKSAWLINTRNWESQIQ